MTTVRNESVKDPKLSTIRFHGKRISWGAVFAGAFIALGIQLLLSLLGLGIGMGAVNPLTENNPVAGLGTGTAIWGIVTFMLALAIGGWVSGRVSKTAHTFEAILHGLLTWVLFVVFNLYMLTSAAGNVISGAGGLLGNTLSMAGQTAAVLPPSLRNKINAKAAEVPTDSASLQANLDSMKAKAPEAEAKAREVGDQVASAVSKGSFVTFFGLLFGALLAGFTAMRGRISEEEMTWHENPAFHLA